LAHYVGAILVIAYREAAPSRAKTSFAPTPCLGQCPNVVWFESAYPPRSGWLAGLCRLKDGD